MTETEKFDTPTINNSAEPRVSLEIDWEGLAVAFENQLPESHSFLELKSGKVHTIVSNNTRVPDSPEPATDFVYIPPRPSREGYRTMQHFLEKIEDPILKERLNTTLVGKGAFRRFKDVLLDYPEIRHQWFTFKDTEVYTYIREWLARERIEVLNEPPAMTSKERIPAGRPRGTEGWRPPVDLLPISGERAPWQMAIAPYDRPQVVFRPSSTALLIVDMQRVFIDPQGSSYLPLSALSNQRLFALMETFRLARLPVIFTRHMHQHPLEDGGALGRWWKNLIVENDRESELMPPFSPRSGERIITKCRYSAFAGTPLLSLLHGMQIQDLLIGGVMTNLCCESTARDAFINDFNVFFLGDGTATIDEDLHHSSLKNIAHGFGRVLGVAEAQELIRNKS